MEVKIILLHSSLGSNRMRPYLKKKKKAYEVYTYIDSGTLYFPVEGQNKDLIGISHVFLCRRYILAFQGN